MQNLIEKEIATRFGLAMTAVNIYCVYNNIFNEEPYLGGYKYMTKNSKGG